MRMLQTQNGLSIKVFHKELRAGKINEATPGNNKRFSSVFHQQN